MIAAKRVATKVWAGGVACVPGMAFYHDDGGERLALFCFAKEDGDLDETCRRLEARRW